MPKREEELIDEYSERRRQLQKKIDDFVTPGGFYTGQGSVGKKWRGGKKKKARRA